MTFFDFLARLMIPTICLTRIFSIISTTLFLLNDFLYSLLKPSENFFSSFFDDLTKNSFPLNDEYKSGIKNYLLEITNLII